MFQLYHHSVSTPSRFIRLIIGEYGQSCELVEEKPWVRRDEFLQLNPAGTLPVLCLKDGDIVVGGGVIAEFLDETVGVLKRENRLMPENPHKRAEVRRLVDWFLNKTEQEVHRYLLGERVFKQMMPEGQSPDSAIIRAGRANLKHHLQYVGWLAASRNWLAGPKFSYADLAAAASLSVMDYLGEVQWDSEPAAKDWYARVKSRPSFRPLLSDKVAGFPPVSHYIDLDF